MQAGRLRHRITVQAVTQTQNSYGEPTETWAAVGTVWADVRPARGSERFVSAGDQEQATITHRVRMRYVANLSPVNYRLVWREKVLDIEAVEDPTGRTAEMVVRCREVVEAGSITVL